jgi:hypothetical protein
VGATRVFLFYRGGGQEDFVSVPMKNTGGVEWAAVIPADAVTGRAIQYYLEARDQRGRAVVGSGSAPNPYIVSISESAAAPTNVPEVDVEDPLAQERLRKRRLAEEARGGKMHRFFIFLLGGFGFGFEPAGNHTEVAYQFQPSSNSYVPQPVGTAGVAFSPFHLGIEFGGFLTKNFSLSAMARIEVFTDNNAETIAGSGADLFSPTRKATSAFAGLVRARYRFLEGRFHPFVSVNIGGGQIRHSLDISSAQTDAEPLVDAGTANAYNNADSPAAKAQVKDMKQRVCPSTCKDTIALGYLLVGGGGGIWVDVHKYLALMLDLNLLGAIGIGDGQSGMNIDFQLGFGAHF